MKVTGPTFTVSYEPADTTMGSVGDFLDDVPRGAVVVIDNLGRTDCTVWGGIMTWAAAERGECGTVIHGTCRDVSTLLEHDYPVWSCGRFMRTGKDRVQLATVGGPLNINGVPVSAGDMICGDADGALVVPASHLTRVVKFAEQIERTERDVVKAVLTGSSLRQARADFGYHLLQRSQRSQRSQRGQRGQRGQR